MRNILLLAPPAAGKGTQSELLQKKYGVVSIATGDLLREASMREDDFGRFLREQLKTGHLIEDATVFKLLKEKFHELSGKNFLLDGFPRNVHQAEELDMLLKSVDEKLDYVFLLDVPKEVLESRITGRRLCKSCEKIYNINSHPALTCCCGGELYQRSDDTKDAFQIRYQTYLNHTLPLVEYYQNKQILYLIDANRSVEEVFDTITSILEGGLQ